MKNHKLFSIGLASTLLFGGFTSLKANAESIPNDTEFEQVKTEFVNQLNESSTPEELTDLLHEMSESEEVLSLSESQKLDIQEEVANSVSETTLEEFQEKKQAEIEEVVSSQVITIDETKTEEYTLSDGSVVELAASEDFDDEVESSTDDLVSSIMYMFSAKPVSAATTQFGPFVNETKNYGNRRYTAWVKLKSWGMTVNTLQLVNRYTISDKGLKMTEISTGGTNGTKFSGVEVKSKTITDYTAEKVGHDINAVAEYKITGALNEGYVDIRSTIKLVRLDKKKKNAHVAQRYQYVD